MNKPGWEKDPRYVLEPFLSNAYFLIFVFVVPATWLSTLMKVNLALARTVKLCEAILTNWSRAVSLLAVP